MDDQQLQTLSQHVGEMLMARGASISVAESCTGGWLAKVLTDVAGSSQWFSYGLVTYSNEAKQRLIKVQASTLQEVGAVSQAVVEQMALGVRALSSSTVAVSISGIAGPDGGSAAKPVGTVWFGLAVEPQDGDSEATVRTEHHVFPGDRQQVRRAAVAQALSMVLKHLEFAE